MPEKTKKGSDSSTWGDIPHDAFAETVIIPGLHFGERGKKNSEKGVSQKMQTIVR